MQHYTVNLHWVMTQPISIPKKKQKKKHATFEVASAAGVILGIVTACE